MSGRPPKVPTLTFDALQRACLERANSTAFNHNLREWSLTDWTNALAGETGELCNFAKKVKRDNVNFDSEMGEEIADIIIYAMIVGEYIGLDVAEEVRNKFNKVSIERGVDIKL